MNKKLMKILALCLVVFMLPTTGTFAETPIDTLDDTPIIQPDDSQIPDDIIPATSVESYRDIVIGYYNSNPVLSSWWDVIALYGAGEDLANYTLPEWTSESLGETASVTDYAGIIFGLIASGQNVHDIWNRDIADELAGMQDPGTGLFGSYPNQQIYSILALDAAGEPYNRSLAVSALIDNFSTATGAFGYPPFDVESSSEIAPDLDITALALLVLDQSEHSSIIDSAVSYIAEQQLESGGFASWGTENSNTLESVIFALSTLGLIEDERFIKNDLSLSDVLSGYILESGMLTWEAGSTDENLMATQQGLLAFADIIAGKSTFLRLSSDQVCSSVTVNVRIEGVSSSVLNSPVTVKCYNPNIIDAVKKVLDTNFVPYIIEDSEYGAYIESIGADTAGKFGGWDGWLIALNGNELSGSADTYSLSDGDDILVYYGMFSPGTLIPAYTLSADAFTQNTPFTVTVTGTYFDYTTSQNVTIPIEGATVEVGGVQFITRDDGIAIVTPTSSGTLSVKIYKESANSYPAIVRTIPFEIQVNPVYSGGGGSYRPSKTPVVENVETTKPEDPKKEDQKKDEEETEGDDSSPTDSQPLTYNDSDTISDWAKEGVKKAVAAGLFIGDENGNFNPSVSLNRAELATILLRLTSSEEEASDVIFSDINSDDWFFGAVCSVYKLGFMNGVSESSFAPFQSVTREQAAVVIARILGLSSDNTAEYTDNDTLSDWAESSVAALSEAKIMEGSGGMFNPKQTLTREMCAVIMARAIDYKSKK